MITTLAFRHLRVKPLRSLFLLLGFSLGRGRDGGPPERGRGDARPVARRRAGRRRRGHGASRGHRRRGDAERRCERHVLRDRSRAVSHAGHVRRASPRRCGARRRAGHREQAGLSRHPARRYRRRPGGRRDPEPCPGDGRPSSTSATARGATCPPIPPGWRPLRSSSTTSSTASISRRAATPPGASGTTSTSCRARRVVVRELSRRRRGARRPLGRPAPRSPAAGRTAATSASPPTCRRSGSDSIPPGPTSLWGELRASSGTVSTR